MLKHTEKGKEIFSQVIIYLLVLSDRLRVKSHEFIDEIIIFYVDVNRYSKRIHLEPASEMRDFHEDLAPRYEEERCNKQTSSSICLVALGLIPEAQ